MSMSFSGEFFCFSFGTSFFVSPFLMHFYSSMYYVDLLWIPVLLYVVGDPWDQEKDSSWSLELDALRMPLVHVMWVFLKSWLLLASLCVGLTLRQSDCEAQSLTQWHSVQTFVQVLITWSGMYLSRVLSCWDLPMDMLLVKHIGSYSAVVWSWPLDMLVLGLFRRTLVLSNNASCCLWLALGKLFGAISDPQVVASSSGPGCMWKD